MPLYLQLGRYKFLILIGMPHASVLMKSLVLFSKMFKIHNLLLFYSIILLKSKSICFYFTSQSRCLFLLLILVRERILLYGDDSCNFATTRKQIFNNDQIDC